MKSWTMRFREGKGGSDMWPYCMKYDVAVITYYPLTDIDLRKYPPHQPDELWKELAPSQKYSLGKVAYEMKRGDIIYVRYEGRITAKGVVQGEYFFDEEERIVDENDVPWRHQIPVEWQKDFQPLRSPDSIGPDQFTVWELTEDQMQEIERMIAAAEREIEEIEAVEGQLVKTEASFRSRNRALITAKKESSNYQCEVCGFNFQEAYGPLGKEFIIAHHIVPIGSRMEPSKTTLDDIALLCANCHEMVHRQDPALTVAEMRAILTKYCKQ